MILKTICKTRFLFVAITVVLIVVLAAYLLNNISDTYSLTAMDRTSIINVVKNYYISIGDGDYRKALSYCKIDDKDNDLHLGIQTRVDCLRELRKSVNFIAKFTNLETYPSEDTIIIQYDKNQKAYCLYSTLLMTNGATIQENVYVQKIGSIWEIVKIESLDPYVGYRIGSYEYS